MDVVPFLGTEFYHWSPLFILVPTALAFFRVMEKTFRVLGLEDFGYGDESLVSQPSNDIESSRIFDNRDELHGLASTTLLEGTSRQNTLEEGRRLIFEGKLKRDK